MSQPRLKYSNAMYLCAVCRLTVRNYSSILSNCHRVEKVIADVVPYKLHPTNAQRVSQLLLLLVTLVKIVRCNIIFIGFDVSQ